MKDSNKTELRGSSQIPADDGAATVRYFWEHHDMKQSLYKRFGFLTYNYCLITKALIRNALTKLSKPLEWIFENNAHGYPSDEVKHGILKAWTTIAKYLDIKMKAKEGNHFFTTQELAELGICEEVYLLTLSRVSKFFAWAYGLQIMPEIQKLIQGVDDSDGEITREERSLPYEELSLNTTQRFPCAIIIDNSLSMGEDGVLWKLRKDLVNLFEEIAEDNEISNCTELYVATCGGGPRKITDFNLIGLQRPNLENICLAPCGQCMMAETIEMVLDDLKERHAVWSEKNIGTKPARILILTDGHKFRGDMSHAISRLQTEFRHVKVFALGASEKADMAVLRTLDTNAAVLGDLAGFFNDVLKSQNGIVYDQEGDGAQSHSRAYLPEPV